VRNTRTCEHLLVCVKYKNILVCVNLDPPVPWYLSSFLCACIQACVRACVRVYFDALHEQLTLSHILHFGVRACLCTCICLCSCACECRLTCYRTRKWFEVWRGVPMPNLGCWPMVQRHAPSALPRRLKVIVCAYVCVHVCVYACVCVCLCVCLSIYLSLCLFKMAEKAYTGRTRCKWDDSLQMRRCIFGSLLMVVCSHISQTCSHISQTMCLAEACRKGSYAHLVCMCVCA